MRTISKLVPIALFGGAVFAQACGDVTQESPSAGYPAAGVIRGAVNYSGPAPCSQNGHIVGNAIVLVFDRRNPPPPSGLANTAVNFGVVPGDALFASQPRTAGSTLSCPGTTVQASGNYAISPMAAGSYYIQAFYDYTGNFLPTFKIRNLPEATDIGGGYFDINDATSLETLQDDEADGGAAVVTEEKSQDPNFQPLFLPVDIGTPGAVPSGSLRGVPTFTMPDTGYIADNVDLTIASDLQLARPYFWPTAYQSYLSDGTVAQYAAQDGGAAFEPAATSPVTVYGNGDSSSAGTTMATPANPDGNPNFQPILSFTQSLQVFAPPNPATVLSHVLIDAPNQFQGSFPQIQLNAGVPAVEDTAAESASDPFHFQIDPSHHGNEGIFVWWNNPPGSTSATNLIPEGNQVARLWPLVVLAKLIDDPTHTLDPEGITAQGADLKQPVVILQGITLQQNSLAATANGRNCTADDKSCYGINEALSGPVHIENFPDPQYNLQSKVTVMIRPSAVCIDPNTIDQGGTLVTPHLLGSFPPSDSYETGYSAGAAPVVSPSVASNPQLATLVKNFTQGCLPTGRYAINVVYPTGQAWTVPNESGGCAALEGNTITSSDPGSCSVQVRPVLNSQGTRAVVEITPDTTGWCAKNPVPAACTTIGQ